MARKAASLRSHGYAQPLFHVPASHIYCRLVRPRATPLFAYDSMSRLTGLTLFGCGHHIPQMAHQTVWPQESAASFMPIFSSMPRILSCTSLAISMEWATFSSDDPRRM